MPKKRYYYTKSKSTDLFGFKGTTKSPSYLRHSTRQSYAAQLRWIVLANYLPKKK